MYEYISKCEFSSVILVIFVAVLTIKFISNRLTRHKLPPGPTRWPVVGNIHLMKNRPVHEVFRDLRTQYGDVFSIKLGSQLFVIINGYETLREAFVKQADDFSDRPANIIFKDLLNEKGIVASSGNYWKHTRTWLLQSLRSFGFGKKSMETKIKNELEECLKIIGEKNGKPFDVKSDLHTSLANIICSISFGQRFEYNDKKIKNLIWTFEENVRLSPQTSLPGFFPILKYLPGDCFNIKRVGNNLNTLLQYLKANIATHKLTSNEEASDLVDTFLIEKENNSESEIFAEENLLLSIHSLFVAGIETTTTTLRWAVLFLLYNRDVLQRLRWEIDNVIGNSRLPSISDREKMPFTEAVIMETLRCGNIAPLALPHGARKNIRFKDFLIPEGSIIMASLDSVMTDAQLFHVPEKFNPDRFLDKDGKLNGTEKVLAFSLGRRVCLGEALARMELFLYLTSLVQRFELLPEDEGSLPELNCTPGLIRCPVPFKFRAVPLSVK